MPNTVGDRSWQESKSGMGSSRLHVPRIRAVENLPGSRLVAQILTVEADNGTKCPPGSATRLEAQHHERGTVEPKKEAGQG